MTVSRELEAEIARLFHAEHWKIGTICTQLGVHDDVVEQAHEDVLVDAQLLVERRDDRGEDGPQLRHARRLSQG